MVIKSSLILSVSLKIFPSNKSKALAIFNSLKYSFNAGSGHLNMTEARFSRIE
jgi:hypothetical protein